MTGKLIFFLGLAALAQGAVVPAVPAAVPLAKLEEFDAVPQYSFAYDVQDAVTGDSKAQYETRNGDIVQGSYSLIEADGTRRIVEYTADPINGFNAVVSREPAAVVAAAVAPSPLLPLRPAIAAVGVAPPAAAPVPSIPAVGPDSDVEVIEARAGPLRTATRDQEIQRQQQREQLRQLQRLQDQQRQQQEQQLRQLQRLQEQQRQQQSSRLQVQQQQSQPQQQQQQQLLRQRQQQRRPQVQREEEPQEEQQQEQQQTPARAVVVGQVQPTASGRLVGLPATAKAIASYPTYPYAAYTAAYTSPLAYATPVAGLAYAAAPALA